MDGDPARTAPWREPDFQVLFELDAGANEYLTKPIDVQELLAFVDKTNDARTAR